MNFDKKWAAAKEIKELKQAIMKAHEQKYRDAKELVRKWEEKHDAKR